MPNQKYYKAFISYSHDDEAFGSWLHKELEKYKIPKKLQEDYPDLPKSLYPIFRDRYELNAGDNLGVEIPKALKNSDALIVVCSRKSANSKWVDKEIIDFKMIDGEDRIFPIIVDGEPFARESDKFDDELECFPEALKYKLDSKGKLTKERTEILASGIKEKEDGEELAKLKLIAGVLGIPFGEFYRRDKEQEKKDRNRAITIWSIVSLVVIGFAIFSWVQRDYAIQEKEYASKTRNEAEKIIENILFKLTNKLDERGNLDILKDSYEVVDNYYKNLENERDGINIKRRIAILKIGYGKYFEAIGDYEKAINNYNKALEIIEKLIADNNYALPDLILRKDLAGIFLSFGDMSYKINSLSKAKKFYWKSLKLTEDNIDKINKLYKNEKVLELFLFDSSAYLTKMGQIFEKENNLIEAEKLYKSSLDIRIKLYEKNTNNNIYLSYIASNLEKLGDIYLFQNKKDEVIKTYNELLKYALILVKNDKKNIRYQKVLSDAYERIGHIYMFEQKYTMALKYYFKSLDIMKKISYINSKNENLMRDLAVTYEIIGKAYNVNAEYDNSMKMYKEALAIRLDLNSKNISWNRELGLCYENIGFLYNILNNIPKAKKMYLKSFYIFNKNIKKDYRNRELQDTFISNVVTIGDFFIDNHFKEAIEIYTGGLNLLKKLKTENLIRTDSMIINLAFIYDRLGEIYQKKSNLKLAEEMYLSAQKISKKLSRNNKTLDMRRDFAISYSRLGDIAYLKKNHKEAKKSYLLALSIIENLSKKYPHKVFLKVDIIEHYYKLSKIIKEEQNNYKQEADVFLENLILNGLLSEEDKKYISNLKLELKIEDTP